MQNWPGKAASKVGMLNPGGPAAQQIAQSQDCFLSEDVKLPQGLIKRFNEEMQLSHQSKNKSLAVSQNDRSFEMQPAGPQGDQMAVASQIIKKNSSAIENAQEDIVIRNVMRNKERREQKQMKEDESKNILRSSQRLDSQPAIRESHRSKRNSGDRLRNSADRHERTSNRSSNRSNRRSEGRNSSRAKKTGNRSRSRTSHKSERGGGSRVVSQSKLVQKPAE